jgi:hypothetical protein
MSTIINGTSNAITFPDSSVQNTSAIVSGYVPYANLPAGSVLQVVTLTTNTGTTTTSTSYVATAQTATITPKYATSKIAVFTTGILGTNSFGGSYGGAATIYRNSTNLATGSGTVGFAALYNSAGNSGSLPCAMSVVDSPATTSATTYTVYIVGSGGFNCQWNSSNNLLNSGTGTITLMEIAA